VDPPVDRPRDRRQGPTVRLPVHVVDQVNKISRTERDLSLKLGRDVSNEEIADVLGFPPQQVEDLRRASRTPVSLNASVGDEEDTELGHLLADVNAPSPEASAEETMRESAVREALDQLSHARAPVLTLRFGLFGESTHTLRDRSSSHHANRARLLEGARLERLLTPARGRRCAKRLARLGQQRGPRVARGVARRAASPAAASSRQVAARALAP
jgi:RNA polymerase primary sigma factor